MARMKYKKPEVEVGKGLETDASLDDLLSEENPEDFVPGSMAYDLQPAEEEVPPVLEPAPDLRKKELPPLAEDYVRNMFPHPKCRPHHALGVLRVSEMMKDLAIQLFYCCPHNEHLAQAYADLEEAYDGCMRAILSEG